MPRHNTVGSVSVFPVRRERVVDDRDLVWVNSRLPDVPELCGELDYLLEPFNIFEVDVSSFDNVDDDRTGRNNGALASIHHFRTLTRADRSNIGRQVFGPEQHRVGCCDSVGLKNTCGGFDEC